MKAAEDDAAGNILQRAFLVCLGDGRFSNFFEPHISSLPHFFYADFFTRNVPDMWKISAGKNRWMDVAVNNARSSIEIFRDREISMLIYLVSLTSFIFSFIKYVLIIAGIVIVINRVNFID